MPEVQLGEIPLKELLRMSDNEIYYIKRNSPPYSRNKDDQLQYTTTCSYVEQFDNTPDFVIYQYDSRRRETLEFKYIKHCGTINKIGEKTTYHGNNSICTTWDNTVRIRINKPNTFIYGNVDKRKQKALYGGYNYLFEHDALESDEIDILENLIEKIKKRIERIE